MRGLPLLIGILSLISIQEMMIVDGGVFIVAQVVISGGAKKKTRGGHLRIEQGAAIESPDRQLVVLVLAGCKSQIDVDIG